MEYETLKYLDELVEHKSILTTENQQICIDYFNEDIENLKRKERECAQKNFKQLNEQIREMKKKLEDTELKIVSAQETYEKECIKRDEYENIERVMRLALLEYFNTLAINSSYTQDLLKVEPLILVQLVKEKYPNSDINYKFFDDGKRESAKLVYALKFNKIQNYENIPMSAIDKYIQYNQNTHIRIRPFHSNGYVRIQESLKKIKDAGIILDDESTINEICNVILKK